jgi:hypothetical protein
MGEDLGDHGGLYDGGDDCQGTATMWAVLHTRIIKRLMKVLTRKGFLIEEQGMSYLDDSDPDRALGPLRAAACTYRIAFGPRAGQKVLTLQTLPSETALPTEQRCVNAQGFSLHAEVCAAPPISARSWSTCAATSPVPPLPTNA